MPQCIETKKYLDWLEENVGKKSLVAVNPMTAEKMVDVFPELGKTKEERMFYAQQLVDLYNKKRRLSKHVSEGYKEVEPR